MSPGPVGPVGPGDVDPRRPSRADTASPGERGVAPSGEAGPRAPFAAVPRQPLGSSGFPPARDPRLSGLTPQPAPWEPPSVQPSGPVTFPPGPTPPGFRAAAPWRRPPDRSPHRTPAPIPAQPTSPPGAPSPAPSEPSDARPATQPDIPTLQADEVSLVGESGRVRVEYVGSGPPTYDAEPTALPPADPEDLGDLVADTVLDGVDRKSVV